jgi:apolipoprotein N-acyltransferase
VNHPPSEIAATRAGSRLVLLPLTAGVLTALAYPPVSIPVLSLVGLVPLLVWLDRPLSTRQVVLGGLAFALPYFGGTSYWMFYLANFTSAGAAGASMFLLLECATFFIFPLTVTVVRSGVRVPLPLLAPLAWVVSEHARALGDLYFPWVTLGYSLSEWPFLIQHADLIGVYGISWWAVRDRPDGGARAAPRLQHRSLAAGRGDDRPGGYAARRGDPAERDPGVQVGPGVGRGDLPQGERAHRGGRA